MTWRAEFLDGPLADSTYESAVGGLPGDGRLIMYKRDHHVIRLDPAVIDLTSMPAEDVGRYELVERVEVGLYRLVSDADV